MPIFSANTSAYIVNNTQAKLAALRNALDDCAHLSAFLSAYAVSDLVAIGFSQSDAQAVMSAVADANAVAQIYSTGLPPSTYPQPGSAYVYAASQRAVIGPLS